MKSDKLFLVSKHTLRNGLNYNLVSIAPNVDYTSVDFYQMMGTAVMDIEKRSKKDVSLSVFYHQDLGVWIVEDEYMPLVLESLEGQIKDLNLHRDIDKLQQDLKQELLDKVEISRRDD